jgi:hypothetical protein
VFEDQDHWPAVHTDESYSTSTTGLVDSVDVARDEEMVVIGAELRGANVPVAGAPLGGRGHPMEIIAADPQLSRGTT